MKQIDELIDSAIKSADEKISKLDESPFRIGGFTSDKIRHLMNNLGAISTCYLEIGSHRGSTLVAAFYNNNLRCVAFDNFSEFEDGTVETELRNNIKEFKGNVFLYKADCFTTDMNIGHTGFDLYLYDGAHDVESQKKAFTRFHHLFADDVIVCVDDYDWSNVKSGTMEGIAAIEPYFSLIHARFLPGAEGFHNGFAVFYLQRKAQA
jgi:hypothetical protein